MHDYGYDLVRAGEPYAYLKVEKLEVDHEFRVAMDDSCEQQAYTNGATACKRWAAMYETGVNLISHPNRGDSPDVGYYPDFQILTNPDFTGGMAYWNFAPYDGVDAEWLDWNTSASFRCIENPNCTMEGAGHTDGYGTGLTGGEVLKWSFSIACRDLVEPIEECEVDAEMTIRVHETGGGWVPIGTIATRGISDGFYPRTGTMTVPTGALEYDQVGVVWKNKEVGEINRLVVASTDVYLTPDG